MIDPVSLTAIITGASSIINKFVPDKDKANELAHEISSLVERNLHEVNLAQIKNNTQEAAHKRLFVAGWRPFIGWVCGLSIANNYLLAPYVSAFSSITIPVLDLGVMMPIILGMLGIAAARSMDKKNGVSTER